MFLLAFGILIFNIFDIQVKKGNYYAGIVEARQDSDQSPYSKRGLIYLTDKNNNQIPAVLNKEYSIIYAVPKEINDAKETAEKLAEIFGSEKRSKILASLSKKNDQYELLKEKATQEELSKIRELNIKGIYIRDEMFRYYPFGNMASHLLGFISSSEDGKIVGRYGVELQFQDELSKGENLALAGRDIFLTIDRNIQSEGNKIIADLMKEWKADSASFIVQNPNTGEILAMGNLPDFNPNEFSEYNIGDFINQGVQSLYEPGSVFKIFTMAAGIDSGKITPDTTYVDTGSVTLNKRTIKNWDLKAYGLQTMTNVIEKSLNTGTIFAEKVTGHNIFTKYVKDFGFGEKTGIELPGEVRGNLKNLDNGKDVNYATASFGQGISLTPIELISAVSSIANGGILKKPVILKDGEKKDIRTVISKDTAKKVTDMMVSAVFKNKLASVTNYLVAGKTGTAFIPDFKNGGYSDSVINTYVGFAPASNPKFSILIKLVNPSGAPLAGTTVVPAFKKMTEYLINYYGIAPDGADKNILVE